MLKANGGSPAVAPAPPGEIARGETRQSGEAGGIANPSRIPEDAVTTRRPLDRFAHLPPPVQRRLHAILQERSYGAGETIFFQDTPCAAIYLVDHGRVKITRLTRDGSATVLCVRQPGEFFCPVSLLDGGPQLGSAIAMGEVHLLSADGPAFASILEDCPELSSEVQRECLSEVRILMQRVESARPRKLPCRLATALLAQTLRPDGPMSPPLVVHLTHQELADLTGGSRESISRILSRLVRLEFVDTRRGQILIRDPEGLQQFASDTDV